MERFEPGAAPPQFHDGFPCHLMLMQRTSQYLGC